MTKTLAASTARRDTHGPAARLALLLFKISVIFFLLAGLAIVVGQTVALIGADATWARSIKSTLAPYAFDVSAPLGSFTLVVSDTDVSGGEGAGTTSDTKSITVK